MKSNKLFLKEDDEQTIENSTQANKQDFEAVAETELERVSTEVDKKTTKEFAADIKATADVIDDGDLGAIVTAAAAENKLTKVLDKALKTTLYYKRHGGRGGKNVLITGLPGSGKSAIVFDWAKHQTSPKVNIFYLDAKNNDLAAFIDGYAVKDATKPNENAITQGYSTNLDPLNRPNSILFLDELNRQVKASIRGSLYSLINEHVVAGNDEDGRRYFPNLLFTIACINPSVPTDMGASSLSDAEMSRFTFNVTFDSDIDTAKDYFNKRFNAELKTLYKNKKKMKPDDFIEDKTIVINQYSLITEILNSGNFSFDTKDDLDLLAGDFNEPKTMLNLRSLTEALEVSFGNKDEFLQYVEYESNFQASKISMFEDILEYYEDPTSDITITVLESEILGVNVEDLPQTIAEFDFNSVDINDETDTELFNKDVGHDTISQDSISILSPAEAENKIKKYNFFEN